MSFLFEGSNSLIILDDCTASRDFKKNEWAGEPGIQQRETSESDGFEPSVEQKQGEMTYVRALALAIGLAVSHFL